VRTLSNLSGTKMQTNWEATAKENGFSSEVEMWKSLYPKMSMSQLAEKFHKGINTIRARLDYHQIAKRNRGGANNTKVDIDQELINDVITIGVGKAALKRGIKPQTLYQRLYYQNGMTVKQIKEEARKQAAQHVEDQPSSTDLPKLDHEPHT
jgi:hypothetical protein